MSKLKVLNNFIDHLQALGWMPQQKYGVIMHPLFMLEVLKELNLEQIGKIDYYKGWKVLVDPSYPIDYVTTINI